MHLANDLTVYVVTTGEPSTAECIERLQKQDCGFRLETIGHVAPMWRAFQVMLDRCQTELFVQVGGDMLLEPWAIRRLVEEIRQQPKEVAFYVGWLWGDAEERPIQGVKVYRHRIMAAFPYQESFSCEMEQVGRMRAAGYRSAALNDSEVTRETCYGVHFSLQTPEMAFRRWKRLAFKYRRYDFMEWLAPYFDKLKGAWLREPTNQIREAAYLGAVAGLCGVLPPDREMDFREADQDYRRLASHVGEYRAGPREMTLYITDRCNFRCEFDGVPCMRETGDYPGAGVPHHGDMTFALVERVLDRWPTIKGVCIAGFGEPLLYPDLRWMIQRMANRGLFCGLISNGAMLAAKLDDITDELKRCNGHYLSVSLNAHCAEVHHGVSKTKTWEKVLDGIRMALDRGLFCGVSYVCTRQNVTHIPAFLAICRELGVRFVDLHNVLPHAGSKALNFRRSVLTHDATEALALLDHARLAPGAELVRSWPKLIDSDPSKNPRRCMSPFVSIGIDAYGAVTGCRRVQPPKREHGHVDRPEMWETDQHFVGLRLAIVGDRPAPDGCQTCFGNWHQ